MKSKLPAPALLLLTFAAATVVDWKLNNHFESRKTSRDYETLSSRTTQPPAISVGMGLLASQRSEEGRLRTAIGMALSIPSSEIEAWLIRGKFTHREGYALTLFQQIAFDRRSRDEPAAFLEWVRENGGDSFGPQLAVLFKNHPEMLTEAFAAAQDPNEKARLLCLVTNADPDLAVAELGKLLPFPSESPWSLNAALEALVKTRPEELEALLKKFPGGSANPLVFAVYTHKLNHQFNEALDELLLRPDGFEILFPSYTSFIRFDPEKLLTRIAEFPEGWRKTLVAAPSGYCYSLRHHENAFDIDWEGLGFTPPESQKMRLSMMGTLVSEDPKAAFEHLDDYGFSGKDKANLLRVSRFGDHTLEQLTEFSQSIKSPEDRAHFLQEIEAKRSAAILTPSEFTETADLSKSIDVRSLFRVWKEEERAEFIEKFPTLAPDDKTRLSAVIINDGIDLPLDLEGAAIDQLLRNPEGHDLPGWGHEGYGSATIAASNYTLKLLTTDSEKTTDWVDSLPNNPARLQVKQNLALNWRNLDPEAAHKWVASQPTADREAINQFLKGK